MPPHSLSRTHARTRTHISTSAYVHARARAHTHTFHQWLCCDRLVADALLDYQLLLLRRCKEEPRQVRWSLMVSSGLWWSPRFGLWIRSSIRIQQLRSLPSTAASRTWKCPLEATRVIMAQMNDISSRCTFGLMDKEATCAEWFPEQIVKQECWIFAPRHDTVNQNSSFWINRHRNRYVINFKTATWLDWQKSAQRGVWNQV